MIPLRLSALACTLLLHACREPDRGRVQGASSDSLIQPLDSITLTAVLPGDFVHPRFSPDGVHLALAEVVSDSGESTRLLILNPSSLAMDTLLDADSARKLGVYKAYVFDIAWQGSDLVTYWVSDGDVGATQLQFSVAQRRLLHDEYVEGDEEDPFSVPDSLRTVAQRISELYPRYSSDAIANALRNRPLLVGDSSVIVQFAFSGIDASVRLLDLRTPADSVLVRARGGRDDIGAFGGGLVAGGTAAFAVRHDSSVVVYALTADGRLRPAVTTPAHMQFCPIYARYSTTELAIGEVRPKTWTG